MVRQAGLSDSEAAKVGEFIQMLEQKGISVSKVILFGSHARGDTHADSDIDVAVVSSQFGRDAAEEMMLLRKVAVKVDSRIEAVPFRPEDLDDTLSTLAEEIRRYGIDVTI
ncbi:MAG: nucleotidyltransferase domain-containing protein [Planctomycetota bacterium]|jgi:predicted nucleotidyltransferase